MSKERATAIADIIQRMANKNYLRQHAQDRYIAELQNGLQAGELTTEEGHDLHVFFTEFFPRRSKESKGGL